MRVPGPAKQKVREVSPTGYHNSGHLSGAMLRTSASALTTPSPPSHRHRQHCSQHHSHQHHCPHHRQPSGRWSLAHNALENSASTEATSLLPPGPGPRAQPPAPGLAAPSFLRHSPASTHAPTPHPAPAGALDVDPRTPEGFRRGSGDMDPQCPYTGASAGTHTQTDMALGIALPEGPCVPQIWISL